MATKDAPIYLSEELKPGAPVTITRQALKDIRLANSRATVARAHRFNLAEVPVTLKMALNRPTRKGKVVVIAV